MEEGLTIRTMKDDIAEFRGQPSASVPVAKNIPEAKSVGKELTPMPKSGMHFRAIGISLGIVALLACIGVGGWYVYTHTTLFHSAPAVLSSTPMDIPEVIPGSAIAVVEYNLSSADNKSIIAGVWGNAGAGSDGAQGTSGDPRSLMVLQGIERAYYFVLPTDSLPFLAIQKSDVSSQFVSQLSGFKYAEQGGWYVIHQSSLDDYVAMRAQGSLKGTDTASAIGQEGYAARFVIRPSSLGAIFNLPVYVPSNRQQIVFDVTADNRDGTLKGGYVLSQDAVPEQLHPDVTGLTALVPTDATFLRVGESFSADITYWQDAYGLLDSSLYSAPAVQQFIAKLATPYAFYARIGADGVPDVGLIVQLPEDLRKKIGYSEPIIEQVLVLFAPLITGRPLTDQVVFADSSDISIPVRYSNLAGKTASLDYTVGDNYILIASSKEGMSVLSQMALAQQDPMLTQEPWTTLLRKEQQFVTPYNMITGLIKDPGVLSLLPRGASETELPIVTSTKGDNTGTRTQATVLFAK